MRLVLFLLFCLPFGAFAAPSADFLKQALPVNGEMKGPPKAFVSPDAETLKQVEDYLNGITTLSADFMQVSPDGSIASGKFYLKRPGKLRWQYDPPTPILIVADGSFLNIYDYELEQVTKLPLDSTLAAFLARPKVSFQPPVKIIKVERKNQTLSVTFLQEDAPQSGSLTLVFEERPLQLRKLIVTDSLQKETQVSLNNVQLSAMIDPALFVFRDPKLGKKQH